MKFKREVLGNGIRLISCYLPNLKNSVSFQIGVGVGTRQEAPRHKGLAHFVEHMAFKGTKRFPGAVQLVEKFGKTGADFNAWTDREYTKFTVDSSPEYINESLNLLLDVFFHPNFRTRDLNIERNVIVSEHWDGLDDSNELVGNLYNQITFGGEHPLGWPVEGNTRSILEIGRNDLQRFHQHYYLGGTNNIVATLSGNFSSKIFGNLRRYLAKIPAKTASLKSVKYESRQNRPRLLLREINTRQAYFCLGFRAYRHRHPKTLELEVIDSLLSDGWSSRLWLEIREKLGFVYGIESGWSALTDCGTFDISGSLAPKNLPTGLKAIREELGKLCTDLVSTREFKRVQISMSESVKSNFQLPDNVCNWMFMQELFEDKLETPQKWLERIYQVKPAAVREVAREIFRSAQLNCAVVAPRLNERKIRKALLID